LPDLPQQSIREKKHRHGENKEKGGREMKPNAQLDGPSKKGKKKKKTPSASTTEKRTPKT